MTTIEETPIATGELTNGCTCTVYDETTGEFTDEPAEECDGFCYESALEFLYECVKHLLDESDEFRVTGIRLWNGEVGGEFRATNVSEFVRGITVKSEWILSYTVFSDRMEFSLSHHDAPMGSSSVVVPLVDAE